MRSKINGIMMDYSLQGPAKAPAVVLLHGFPFSKELWKAQAAALKGAFRVLSYDLRGMGKSALGKAPQPLEAYVDDLFALMDKLGIAKAVLGGMSMGGYIVLRAAQREPARVSALVLCDTKAEADPDAARLKRAAGIKAIRSLGPAAYAKGMLPTLLAESTRRGKPKLAKGLLSMMLKTGADGMANALSAMAGRTDCSAMLPGLSVPTLVCVGEEDALTPVEVSKAMASAIPGARLVTISKAGHACVWEQPQIFNEALLGFLRSLNLPA